MTSSSRAQNPAEEKTTPRCGHKIKVVANEEKLVIIKAKPDTTKKSHEEME